MLADELAAQRTFLSAEEEASLDLPAAHDDEDNLAWQRVRGRRSWFFPALRDRYIRDGRPEQLWRSIIAEEESAAGGVPTFITHLAPDRRSPVGAVRRLVLLERRAHRRRDRRHRRAAVCGGERGADQDGQAPR